MQRTYRLRQRRDFRRVFKYGKSTANRHFVVYVMPNKENTPLKVGISISKKVAKRAVDRNKVKRLVKEVVRHWIGQLPPDHDLVIIARNASVDLDYMQIEQSLHHLFRKAGLFKTCRCE